MINNNLLNKVENFSPNNKLAIMTPQTTAVKLDHFVIEAVPRNEDMIFHVTALKPMEELPYQRIVHRIILALNNKVPEQYYTNIIPVRQLNSVAIEIFKILTHPQTNTICSEIFRALMKEFSRYDNPTAVTQLQQLVSKK